MRFTSKIYSRISEKCSNNSMEKENVCYVKYYYEPGLSARNRIATQPPEGTPTVFLSTGSTRLKILGSFLGLKFPNPSPTTKKLRP
jgi:hypothetical protein